MRNTMKNNRTFLEKLLDGAEVKWKPLGKVTDIKTGQSVSKNIIAQNPGIYPVINSGREPLGFINVWNTENDPIGITTRGAGVGSITWQEGKYFRGNLNYSVTIKSEYELNVRFLYHMLLHFQKEIHNLCSFTGIPALNASELKKLEIPIPPLPVQTEIVKILDALTALTRELTSELTSELILRRKQYEYYRERLLSFDSLERLNMGGAKKKLIDVAYFQNGKGHEKNIDENGSFIVINSKFISTNGAVKKYCNDQLVPLFKEDILIVMSDLPNGKALAKTFFVTEDNKYTLNQRIGRITVKEEVELLPSFVNHFLNRNKQLTKYDNGTDQTNLRKDQILDVVIPIPPLEEQQRIVSILDKFETLTNSITEGLPLAIEQSQKRYEYYRELLLNFPGRE